MEAITWAKSSIEETMYEKIHKWWSPEESSFVSLIGIAKLSNYVSLGQERDPSPPEGQVSQGKYTFNHAVKISNIEVQKKLSSNPYSKEKSKIPKVKLQTKI